MAAVAGSSADAKARMNAFLEGRGGEGAAVTASVGAGSCCARPPADVRESSVIGRFLTWLEEARGLRFDGYDDLHRWTVSDLEGFWSAIWEHFAVRSHTPYERVLGRREMPGAEWFPGATLNYAEHALGIPEDAAAVAVVAHSQTRDPDRAHLG